MSEGKLRKQVDRGQRAQALLENSLIQEFFENVEQTIDEAWKGSLADDEKARNNAYLMHRLFQNFKQQFVNAVRTGEKAGKDLLAIKDPSKLRRVIGGR